MCFCVFVFSCFCVFVFGCFCVFVFLCFCVFVLAEYAEHGKIFVHFVGEAVAVQFFEIANGNVAFAVVLVFYVPKAPM